MSQVAIRFLHPSLRAGQFERVTGEAGIESYGGNIRVASKPETSIFGERAEY